MSIIETKVEKKRKLDQFDITEVDVALGLDLISEYKPLDTVSLNEAILKNNRQVVGDPLCSYMKALYLRWLERNGEAISVDDITSPANSLSETRFRPSSPIFKGSSIFVNTLGAGAGDIFDDCIDDDVPDLEPCDERCFDHKTVQFQSLSPVTSVTGDVLTSNLLKRSEELAEQFDFGCTDECSSCAELGNMYDFVPVEFRAFVAPLDSIEKFSE